MIKRTVYSAGISLKKKFGQHFLRDQSIVNAMMDRVPLATTTSVFEVGPGDGFLTRSLLQAPIARLWSFEIDARWAKHLNTTIHDKRFTLYEQNFLDVDPEIFAEHAPWVIMANLPYQITFPILRFLQRNRQYLTEGVIMIQEEVAQKLVKTRGRGYGYPSLFFNHYFEIELLLKVPPTAFFPPPKVESRLVYLKTKQEVKPIPNEEEFWLFIKRCFAQPRRTLRNNLQQTHFDMSKLSDETLSLRAQQMSLEELIGIWTTLSTEPEITAL
jgi:16S rRNA (adenine1518-N6/adenine1519-N6)-dimethyltransferase